MTETLTGKQVLALLAQDEVPEIEYSNGVSWYIFKRDGWSIDELRTTFAEFRIKPTPQRRLSVTLANGEVVSWPEPVRGVLKDGQDYFFVDDEGLVCMTCCSNTLYDHRLLAFGNIHLTREAAQEHADALRKINTQGGE